MRRAKPLGWGGVRRRRGAALRAAVRVWNSRGLFNFDLIAERFASAIEPSSRSADVIVQGLGLGVGLLGTVGITLGGLFAALGETTYYLAPELIRREIRFGFWTHIREFRPGRLLLRLTCEKLEAPEKTLRKWALDVQDVDGKLCRIIDNKTVRRYFSREECSADALQFAEASGWKLDEKIECAPQRSTVSI